MLCIDDEEIVLIALKGLLERNFSDKFEIELAVSAQEALQITEELEESGTPIVVIISDWLMPGMKGDKFLMKVQEHAPKAIKIMISGHADEKSVSHLFDENILDRFIRKPWESDELINIIKENIKDYETCKAS